MTAEHENETRVRLRRTKSVTHAEEIQKAEQRVRKSQPDKPIDSNVVRAIEYIKYGRHVALSILLVNS
ncbi:diacylglycerol O-acyltransferase 1 isoform X1 [Vespula maculifrons]|uniref:Uncharacterized protein n=4 Tax=Vespula TaxID=7451 RepID=A0A834J9W3_VESGE|nr:hypothetical protein HZH66_013577 [Vespula vulgaris]KAF7383277.1 hypothetical protein HZH68_015126 [Vespula germanica]KAF7398178.1 hypothetical protein H0235_016186 [Vespula pensylvanica]